MICTTTSSIPGKSITHCLGLVAGEAVLGGNFLRDLAASVRDVTGGRVGSSESLLSRARDSAVRDMCERARKMGAHAIVGVRVDVEMLGDSGSMLLAHATGTAVCTELAANEEAAPEPELAYIARIGDAEKGPFSIAQLRELIAAGRISANVSVRPDAGGEWRPLSQVAS